MRELCMFIDLAWGVAAGVAVGVYTGSYAIGFVAGYAAFLQGRTGSYLIRRAEQ